MTYWGTSRKTAMPYTRRQQEIKRVLEKIFFNVLHDQTSVESIQQTRLCLVFSLGALLS